MSHGKQRESIYAIYEENEESQELERTASTAQSHTIDPPHRAERFSLPVASNQHRYSHSCGVCVQECIIASSIDEVCTHNVGSQEEEAQMTFALIGLGSVQLPWRRVCRVHTLLIPAMWNV